MGATYFTGGLRWTPAMTASASRRFGTVRGETKEVPSILASPVRDSASMSSIFSPVATNCGSLWKPSRVTTSCTWTCCTLLPVRWPLHDPAFSETGYLGIAVGMRGENCLRMLAQRRADPLEVSGGLGKLGNDTRHLQLGAVGQLHVADHPSSQVLGVAGDIRHAVDLSIGHLRRIEECDDLVAPVASGPIPDDRVELVATGSAS